MARAVPAEGKSGFESLCEYVRNAVAREPDNPVFRNDFAVLLSVRGESDAALEQIQRAVTLDPSLTIAYVNGAVIAGSKSGCEASLPWLDSALRLDPDHVPAILLRSRVLATLGRGEEALELGRRAAALKPDDDQVHETLGIAFRALQRYDEALQAMTEAQARSSSGKIGARKAMFLLEQGRQAEALAEMHAVLEREPELAIAWFVQSFAKNFVVEEREIEAMERIVDSPNTPALNDKVQLEFAIGRAYLAKGKADAAFSHLEAGNRLKRSAISFDIAGYERYAEERIAAYTPEVFKRMRGLGAPSELPIFVVGMPRSGTSLIEQILASHPRVFGAGELGLVSALAPEATVPGVEGLPELGNSYLRAVSALAPDAVRVVDKMPLNFFHLGFIHLMLPRAIIIHCRRNPMDTCLSCYLTLFEEHMEFSYNQSELGRFYRAYARLMDHWRNVLPPNRLLEIDYEDVVDGLPSEARRMIEFCGLPWDDRCLEFHKTERAVRTASANQVRQPLYRKSVGRWMQYRPYLNELTSVLEPNAG